MIRLRPLAFALLLLSSVLAGSGRADPRVGLEVMTSANVISFGWGGSPLGLGLGLGPQVRAGALWPRLALYGELNYLIDASFNGGYSGIQLLTAGADVEPLLWASALRRARLYAIGGFNVGGLFVGTPTASSRFFTFGFVAGVGAHYYITPRFAVGAEAGTRIQLEVDGGVPGGGAGIYLGLSASFVPRGIDLATREKEQPPIAIAPPPGGQVVEITTQDDDKHHCQAGRMVIVIGEFDDYTAEDLKNNHEIGERIDARLAEYKAANHHYLDQYAKAKNPTMRAARDLAAELQTKQKHVHAVAYNGRFEKEPDLDNPSVYANGTWSRFKTGKNNGKNSELLTDCCWLDEVLVMMHGSTIQGFQHLIKSLPEITGGRPIKKLILWICDSSEKFFPNSGKGAEKNYENLAWVVKPKPCLCGCAVGADHPAYDPDGKRTTCPDGKYTTTILASGEFGGHAVKLSLDLDPAHRANVFTSPDGKVREISVDPDGKITAQIVGPSVPVFAGTSTGSVPDAKVDKKAEKYNPTVQHADSAAVQPKDYVAPTYTAPKGASGGCIPDAN